MEGCERKLPECWNPIRLVNFLQTMQNVNFLSILKIPCLVISYTLARCWNLLLKSTYLKNRSKKFFLLFQKEKQRRGTRIFFFKRNIYHRAEVTYRDLHNRNFDRCKVFLSPTTTTTNDKNNLAVRISSCLC